MFLLPWSPESGAFNAKGRHSRRRHRRLVGAVARNGPPCIRPCAECNWKKNSMCLWSWKDRVVSLMLCLLLADERQRSRTQKSSKSINGRHTGPTKDQDRIHIKVNRSSITGTLGKATVRTSILCYWLFCKVKKVMSWALKRTKDHSFTCHFVSKKSLGKKNSFSTLCVFK